MKKTLLIISAAFFVSLGANSQVTNVGFENWTSAGAYDEPDGWATYNFLADFGLPALVSKDASAHSGNFSAKIETAEVDVFGSVDTLGGLLMLGTVDVMGVPYTARPTAMEFYYKYSTPGADFGQVIVLLTKWDDQNSTQASIGGGIMEINAATNFTLGTVDIEYDSPEAPDSIQIFFSSSMADAPIPGTVLNVDDISFVTQSTAVASLASQKPMVYPNPAKDFMYVKTAGMKITEIEITDLSGRLVEKVALSGANTQISTSQLNNGNYFYELKNGQESVSRGQFHVAH
ncbi:MAG: hypothetical protein K0R65_819 [Crocinitomicaceae bacterium]|jgi:hypothetical protein|nr:hypothetical protein [Crocinitomicaceae bacterium]